jgi:hypothetical protein
VATGGGAVTDRTTRTPKKPWQERFIEALAAAPNVSGACLLAGIGRTTAYEERKRNPAFATRWDETIEAALDVAEAELYRRSVHGVRKPVYQSGKRVGYIQEYSDTLLIFMLKCRRPEVYRDQQKIEVNGGLTVDHVVPLLDAARKLREGA